ncbi:MAG TPA: hypothetical protein VEK38_02885 [Candidatus Bathyarchaeia archaeon]|nr:hypothetical protein [Candidatus Bathyarchaeia archaeon]
MMIYKKIILVLYFFCANTYGMNKNLATVPLDDVTLVNTAEEAFAEAIGKYDVATIKKLLSSIADINKYRELFNESSPLTAQLEALKKMVPSYYKRRIVMAGLGAASLASGLLVITSELIGFTNADGLSYQTKNFNTVLSTNKCTTFYNSPPTPEQGTCIRLMQEMPTIASTNFANKNNTYISTLCLLGFMPGSLSLIKDAIYNEPGTNQQRKAQNIDRLIQNKKKELESMQHFS